MVYLITKERLSLYDAYAHVKLLRGIVNPNIGFWHQMCDYEEEKHGKASVKIERITQK